MLKPFVCAVLMATATPSFCGMQADTILVYDIGTHNTSTILPVAFNSTVTADFTSSSPGTMGHITPLSLTPPTSNLFTGTAFSSLAKASSFFTLTDYPVRTVVRLQKFYPDTTRGICTGMIVGTNAVLTSANCLFDFVKQDFVAFDSIRASPAFNNGAPQQILPSSTVKRIYMFKKFFKQTSWEDAALLELTTPIGIQTGWTGIGFNQNNSFITNNVFHKFSYPAQLLPGITSPPCNGDTLFYNYGSIYDSGPFYNVNSPLAQALPGQSGSTFLYTNNVDYYSIGLCSFSTQYSHYKITNAAFYQLKNVLRLLSVLAPVNQLSKTDVSLKLAPNPLLGESVLTFDFNPNFDYKVEVIDHFGRVVRTLSTGRGSVVIQKEDLSCGIYLIRLTVNEAETHTLKLLVD